ncbi:hypothetical protein Tco_0333240 [Tanacetum coccineum]
MYGDSVVVTLVDSILILEIMSRRFFLRGIYLITGSRKDGDGDPRSSRVKFIAHATYLRLNYLTHQRENDLKLPQL